MKEFSSYKTAGILLKVSLFINVFYMFFILKTYYNGTLTVVVLGVTFLFYMLAHFVQLGKPWTRFPVLLFCIFSVGVMVMSFSQYYNDVWWLIFMIAEKLLQITATYMIFAAARFETEMEEDILDRDMVDDDRA